MKKHPLLPGAHERARILRRNMTKAERRLWQILRSQQLSGHKFRRQVPFGRYIADFVCHEARLIVEVDGGQHNPLLPLEAERTAFLQGEGHRILRFWNNDVLANLGGVYDTIVSTLGQAITPTQTLPHQGGGI
jgi:very-short-patch-repair endonuclease